ncbi:MAG: RnfABCDGE type electron transport complex subunit G [Firmicutes bacterium]|nr:RnfABCDGE type electron transport complex subunit G [Bacillota bacterium]
MRDYLKLTGILLIVCIVAAGVLGVTNAVTYEKIIEQAIRENDEARKEVLSEAEEFNKVDENGISDILSKSNYEIVTEVYEGRSQGQTVGYTVKTSPKGYGGTVEIVIGIDMEGKVKGIKVGENSETPGLGKNAATPKFQGQFVGKDWDGGVVLIKNGVPKDNEILSIAGATITSTAVVEGVNTALELVEEITGN